MDNKPKIKFYNLQSSGDVPSQGGGRHYIPPPEKIRQWAHESTEGGTAFCFKCHERFAMYYMRTVRSATFRTDFACKDCIKEHNLQVIK